MKEALFTCLIHVIAIAVISSAQAQSSEVENKIRQTQQKIDAQVEKINQARYQADSEMALAKLRIGEQLRRSQEDLARQTDILERYREQLAEQRADTEAALAEIRKSWSGQIDQAASEVEAGIQYTNSLINKMQTVNKDISDEAIGKDSAPSNGNSANGGMSDITVQAPPQPAVSNPAPPPTAGG